MIPEIDEQQLTMIALPVDPASQADCLTDVVGPQDAARVGSGTGLVVVQSLGVPCQFRLEEICPLYSVRAGPHPRALHYPRLERRLSARGEPSGLQCLLDVRGCFLFGSPLVALPTGMSLMVTSPRTRSSSPRTTTNATCRADASPELLTNLVHLRIDVDAKPCRPQRCRQCQASPASFLRSTA